MVAGYRRRYVPTKTKAKSSTPHQPYVDAMLVNIFQNQNARLQELLVSIAHKNAIMHKDSSEQFNPYAFSYEGKMVTTKSLNHKEGKVTSLHTSLSQSYKRYEHELMKTEKDKRKIRNILSKTMRKCGDVQGFRDMFPDALVALVPDIKDIPREREEGWRYPEYSDERKEFTAAVDLMIYYIGKRLLR